MKRNRLARQRCDTAVWLGAGALTLGIGAATLAGAAGTAHADSADAGPAKASVGSATPHSAAKAVGHKAPHAVHVSAPKSMAAMSKHMVKSVAASATLTKTPLQVFCDGSVRLLVALSGMNPTTPTPARGNLWQLGLYSVARWLADTANPGGIPKVQMVTTRESDALTGVVRGQVVFADAAGDPLTYQVTVDPELGKVMVDPDGSFTFTPLTSTILGAPEGGLSVKMKVTAINGLQRATKDVVVVVGNPFALPKKTVTVGTGPIGIAFSPNGTRVAVTNNGDGTVSLINSSTTAVTNTIPVGTQPAGVAFDPSGSQFYVVNGNGTVSVVSVVSSPPSTVGTPIGVGANPLFAAIGPAGTPAAGKLYVTNFGNSTLSVIDTATNQVTGVPVASPSGYGLEGVAISPDGTHLWVGNTVDSTILVADTATNAVIKTISVPVTSGVGFIALSADGHSAYVTNFTANTVSVINTTTYATAATIPVGAYPSGIAFSPDGSVAYVTNQQANTVSVINTATKTVIKTITVGNTPIGVAASPDGTHLYVANLLGASITVIPV